MIYFRNWTALLVALFLASGDAVAQQRGPTSLDLATFTQVADLRLSPDGEELLYVTRRGDPANDRYIRELWRAPAAPGGTARRVGGPLDAHTPRWVSGVGVSFLAAESGPAQLHLVADPGGEPRRLTDHASGIRAYAWAPRGDRVAFTALGPPDDFERNAATARRGAVVSKFDFVIYRLFRNEVFQDAVRPVELWVLDFASGTAEKISGEMTVTDFVWSPSGDALAFSATPGSGARTLRRDLFVRSIENGTSRTILEGREGEGFVGSVSYSQPRWSPDGERIAFLRKDHSDGWSAIDELGIVEVETGESTILTEGEKEELYRPSVFWITPERILLEDRVRGRHGLFSIPVEDGPIEPVVFGDEYSGEFRFSADGTKAAWIRQSVDRPPEIYVAEPPFTRSRRVTRLNARFDSIWLPEAELVRWTSTDGVPVEGWLVKPRGYRPAGRQPLLVVVHGGPSFPVVNSFTPYPWPYPAQLFAARGYAVLYPNYRGTGSYGKAFREPSAHDAEPVADIVTGIEHLIERGIADPEHIGIMGQSHGSWLGPTVVTRNPDLFEAASFAEGAADYISVYGQMSGWLNLNVHERYFPGTPYDALDRYIELSPIFHLAGTETPMLLEYGQQSLAVQGMEYASALWRHGIPHELVIYPETGHGITSAALRLDSMERNLDWFDYWMLGREDPAPGKAGRYARWEAMKRGENLPGAGHDRD